MHVGAPFTILLAALSLGGAIALHVGASPHRDQAGTHLQDARSEGSAYVATFDGAHIDAQLAHFKQRRAAVATASRWLLARDLCVMLAGALIIVAWIQAFLRRLESLRTDVAQPADRPSSARPLHASAG